MTARSAEVGDAQDARLERQRLVRQKEGIAVSAGPLVVIGGAARDLLEAGNQDTC